MGKGIKNEIETNFDRIRTSYCNCYVYIGISVTCFYAYVVCQSQQGRLHGNGTVCRTIYHFILAIPRSCYFYTARD